MTKMLDELVTAVTRSAKYAQISPQLVREIGALELAKRPKLKDAVKATKTKLHQVGGAYLDGPQTHDRWLAQLRATAGSPTDLRATCIDIMRHHASTRERIPILDTFYTTTLAGLPPVRSVLDIACGYNPLARPWMPFQDAVEYTACDIYADLTAFVQAFMAIVGMHGRGEQRDVLHDPPTRPVDLALLLKTLPCLEQIDKQASTILLDALDARYLLISYPVASLGGRQKGMVETYSAHFEALAAGRRWQVERFEFATELAFLVKREA